MISALFIILVTQAGFLQYMPMTFAYCHIGRCRGKPRFSKLTNRLTTDRRLRMPFQTCTAAELLKDARLDDEQEVAVVACRCEEQF